MRTLEAELGQYTDEDDLPRDHEAMVRPGGLVRLNETDETPRYLGPSSGIAMTRIVMDEAKRYTDSQRISQLIPDVRVRRQAAAGGPATRSQSFFIPPSAISQKKSYPMISAVPAEKPPTRGIADKLFEVYYQRGMSCTNGIDRLPGPRGCCLLTPVSRPGFCASTPRKEAGGSAGRLLQWQPGPLSAVRSPYGLRHQYAEAGHHVRRSGR